MNKIKLSKIVGYIENQHEFPFDIFDVEDDFQTVLDYFCICVILDSEEEEIIRQELLRLAAVAQTAEMVRLALQSADPSFAAPLTEQKHFRQQLAPSIGFIDWLSTFPPSIRESFFSSFSSCPCRDFVLSS